MTEPRSVATTDTHDAVGNLVRDIKGSTKKPSAYDADDRLRDIKVGKAGGAWAFMATLGSGGVRTLGLPTVHGRTQRHPRHNRRLGLRNLLSVNLYRPSLGNYEILIEPQIPPA